jgi:hypothetical protein
LAKGLHRCEVGPFLVKGKGGDCHVWLNWQGANQNPWVKNLLIKERGQGHD